MRLDAVGQPDIWNTHTQSYHYPVHVPPFCYKGTDDHKSLDFPVAHVAARESSRSVWKLREGLLFGGSATFDFDKDSF